MSHFRLMVRNDRLAPNAMTNIFSSDCKSGSWYFKIETDSQPICSFRQTNNAIKPPDLTDSTYFYCGHNMAAAIEST